MAHYMTLMQRILFNIVHSLHAFILSRDKISPSYILSYKSYRVNTIAHLVEDAGSIPDEVIGIFN
jgi:hypothetical protein